MKMGGERKGKKGEASGRGLVGGGGDLLIIKRNKFKLYCTDNEPTCDERRAMFREVILRLLPLLWNLEVVESSSTRLKSDVRGILLLGLGNAGVEVPPFHTCSENTCSEPSLSL